MGIGALSQRLKRLFKKRDPLEGAPPLPQHPVRLKLAREAFEKGLVLITDADRCKVVAKLGDKNLVIEGGRVNVKIETEGAWWKEMAPLSMQEREAVVWRVREFARHRLAAGQAE